MDNQQATITNFFLSTKRPHDLTDKECETDISKPKLIQRSTSIESNEDEAIEAGTQTTLLTNSTVSSQLDVGSSLIARCDSEVSSQGVELDLSVDSLNLYPSVTQWLKDNGMEEMFHWQKECLERPGVLHGRNLVVSAPTSSGKTFIGDIILTKRAFEDNKKVLVILPFVSIVREKMVNLQRMLKETHLRVGGFMGSFHTRGGFESVNIAICTVEKANNYILRLLQQNKLGILGAIIVDEIHLISDSSRGYLLELLLTKVMHACRINSEVKIQIVGMSATLPNINQLGKWLDAEVYETDFRPVPLTEKVYMSGVGHHVKRLTDEGEPFLERLKKPSDLLEKIIQAVKKKPNTPDKYFSPEVITFCMNALKNDPPWSVLVFFNDKAGTESLALQIAETIKGKKGESLKLIPPNASVAVELLNGCPLKPDPLLEYVVRYGVAFHHAGLCHEHKEIIEDTFKKGFLRVIVATSTLSSGVNLPARRVIVKSPCFFGKMMDIMTYRQMIGRAGRKGMDDEGESVLLCSATEVEIGKTLATASSPPLTSSLFINSDGNRFQRAILEAIVTGMVSTTDGLKMFVERTFCYFLLNDEEKEQLKSQTADVVNDLKNMKCIEEHGNIIEATKFGQACIASSSSPAEGLALLEELQSANGNFKVLTQDLHLLYQIVPQNIAAKLTINASKYSDLLQMYYQSSEYKLFVETMGILNILPGDVKPDGRQQVSHREAYSSDLPKGKDTLKLRKFFVALIFFDLIQEVSIDELNRKYGIEKGQLQDLQTHGAAFASMVASFCERLGWRLSLLFDDLQPCLEFGVKKDLVDLMRLQSINTKLARRLVDSGLTTVKDVAFADFPFIYKALIKEEQFVTDSPLKRKNQKMWINSQRTSMTMEEIAILLHEEAKYKFEEDIGEKIFVSHEMTTSQSNTSGISSQLSLDNYAISEENDLLRKRKNIVITSNEEIESFLTVLEEQNGVSVQYEVVKNNDSEKLETASGEAVSFQEVNDGIVFDFNKWILKRLFLCCGKSVEGIPTIYHFAGKKILKLLIEKFITIVKEFKSRSQVIELTVFDTMAAYKVLNGALGLSHDFLFNNCQWVDLRIVHWLRNPTEQDPSNPREFWAWNDNFEWTKYLPPNIRWSENIQLTTPVKCLLMTNIKNWLELDLSESMRLTFRLTEGRASVILAHCSATGFRINRQVLIDMKTTLVDKESDMSEDVKDLIISAENVNSYIDEDGRVRGRFETFTETGRVSMSSPNLLIMRRKKVTKFNGSGEMLKVDPMIRKAFIPSEGHVLLSADYRQLEFRILSYLSKDENALAILSSGEDVFKDIAKEVFSKENTNDVTEEERCHAKGIVYGIIYGMGNESLASKLGVTKEDAEKFREMFSKSFPRICKFSDEALAVSDGYIDTIAGRRKLFSSLQDKNSKIRSKEHRSAFNYKIQGSAEDIIKKAMVILEEKIIKLNLQARLVLKMHDELIFDVPSNELHDFVRIVQNCMSEVGNHFPDIAPNGMKLPVNIKTGSNWGELSPYFTD